MEERNKKTVKNRIRHPKHPRKNLSPQRKAVLQALSDVCGQHPTASELHELTKRYVPGVCMATIYNTLDALRRKGIVNEHAFHDGSSRFCLTKPSHVHVQDKKTGKLIDVKLKRGVKLQDVFDLPEGVKVTSMQAYLYGKIPS